MSVRKVCALSFVLLLLVPGTVTAEDETPWDADETSVKYFCYLIPTELAPNDGKAPEEAPVSAEADVSAEERALRSLNEELNELLGATVVLEMVPNDGNWTCADDKDSVVKAAFHESSEGKWDRCTKGDADAGCSGAWPVLPAATSSSRSVETPAPTPPESEDEGFPTWGIVLICVGAVVLVGAIAGGVLYSRSRRPHFDMTFGEQCCALDEMEAENLSYSGFSRT